MAATSGPNINNDGLIFYYDMNNTEKSNKGKPATNYMPTSKQYATEDGLSYTGTGYSFLAEYTSWAALNVNNNEYITCTGEFKVSPDRKAAGGSVRVYIWTASGTNGWIRSTSVGTSSTEWVPFKTTLQRKDATDGVDAIYCRFGVYHYPGDIDPGTSYIRNIMITNGNMQVPFTSGTRSDSEAIVDLTGNYTTTVNNNLTYSEDGTFSFNGSSDRFDVPGLVLSGPRSMFLWVYYDAITGLSEGFSLNGIQESGAYSYIGIADGGQGYFYAGSGAGGGLYNAYYNINEWYYVGFTLASNGTIKVYKNGVLVDTKAGVLGNASTQTFQMGAINSRYFHNGKIGNCVIFNRTLSDAEVKQNFNAHRSRYGL